MASAGELPVIILAAGRGVRLGSMTGELPKCMLECGGTTIIRRQVKALQENGLPGINIVTGYRDDLLRSHLEGCGVSYIHSAEWATTNNIYSLHLAREKCAGGFYLLNGDVAFDFGILEKFAGTSDTAMVIDDVKVLGEYIGVMRFDAVEGAKLFGAIGDFVSRGDTGVWYENAIQEIMGELRIRPDYTGGMHWIEVDTQEDFRKMEELFS